MIHWLESYTPHAICPLVLKTMAPFVAKSDKIAISNSDLIKLTSAVEYKGNTVYPASLIYPYFEIFKNIAKTKKKKGINTAGMTRLLGAMEYRSYERRGAIIKAAEVLTQLEQPVFKTITLAPRASKRYVLTDFGVEFAAKIVKFIEQTVGSKRILRSMGSRNCEGIVKAVTEIKS